MKLGHKGDAFMNVNHGFIAKNWKQSKCLSTAEWINKVVYPYNGISFRDKKERAVKSCQDMDES